MKVKRLDKYTQNLHVTKVDYSQLNMYSAVIN